VEVMARADWEASEKGKVDAVLVALSEELSLAMVAVIKQVPVVVAVSVAVAEEVSESEHPVAVPPEAMA